MVVATGFFDGVHTGHRLVLNHLVETAKARGEESMVITFWPHPRNVLQSDALSLRLLTSLEEKKALIRSLGVDRTEVVEFTKQFSRLTAYEYFSQYVAGLYSGTAVVLGYDNKVGSDCADSSAAAAAARRACLDVVMAPRLASDTGTAVSSTWIRAMIQAGDVSAAAGLLGYNYSLKGVVVSGEHIGKSIGCPTANISLYEPLKLVPGEGTFLVKARTLGRDWFGMCNIGTRPTVREGNPTTIETHIFGLDEDIYGLDISLSFLTRIRKEIRFASLDALRIQLEKDKEHCKNLIATVYGNQ